MDQQFVLRVVERHSAAFERARDQRESGDRYAGREPPGPASTATTGSGDMPVGRRVNLEIDRLVVRRAVICAETGAAGGQPVHPGHEGDEVLVEDRGLVTEQYDGDAEYGFVGGANRAVEVGEPGVGDTDCPHGHRYLRLRDDWCWRCYYESAGLVLIRRVLAV